MVEGRKREFQIFRPDPARNMSSVGMLGVDDSDPSVFVPDGVLSPTPNKPCVATGI
jgi:hypothetical protein